MRCTERELKYFKKQPVETKLLLNMNKSHPFSADAHIVA
jgi:hypothetical protein